MDDITQTLAHAPRRPTAMASWTATCTRCSRMASAASIRTCRDAWRQRFIRKRAHQAGGGLTLRYAHPNGTVVRDDAKPESGATRGQ